MAKPRVAIVADWLVGGGAERVVEQLHKMYPGAPIYTSYCTSDWQRRLNNKVVTGFLQKWPFGPLRKFMGVPRIWWFTRLDLSSYDLVISVSGNGEAKGIKTNPNQTHICYCNSPVHFYWRHYDDYIKRPGFGVFDPLARLGLKLLVKPLRRWDYQAAQRPDYIIANSSHIQADIKKYYKRDSVIIHPPIDIERFKILDKPAPTKNLGAAGNQVAERQVFDVGSSNFSGSFITVGRQTGYKRTDIIVEACARLGLPLKVLGNGPMHKKLIKMAGPTIEFMAKPSDEEVAAALAGAQAFLFAAFEDFGVTPVEALAAGTPVIAYRAGGALDYVTPGQTGEFFNDQTAESLMAAIKKFDPKKYDPIKLRSSATSFSSKRFRATLLEFVSQKMSKNQARTKL